ncbi:MAG: energy transducer TonB [Acidobacteria bacterium]|nr:energy transducer TonB [Acidobacteriota bacterium]
MNGVLFDRDAPRMPQAGWRTRGAQWVAAGLTHTLALGALMLALHRMPPVPARDVVARPEIVAVTLPRIVFIPNGPPGDGGGGGGNRQSGPIRRAEGKGHDAATLRTRRAGWMVTATETAAPIETLPSVLLDARPLASGTTEQLGLPVGGVSFGTSTGPGSGGGVGTGSGTGIGPGTGPGVGPGSGGGTGGGLYRPGGAVTSPRVLTQTRPTYTSEALSAKIQGPVWLELVVTREGRPDAIRVVRSLDPGLDAEAVKAVREWRFAPGRLANVPVDVLVTVVMDFSIR